MYIYNLDTSIWLDYYEKRGINGKHALKLIIKIIYENSIIIYSDLHLKELKNLGYSNDEINDVFYIVKSTNIKKVYLNKEQLKEAKKLSYQKKIPRADALHAILARDNNAIMISRDKHFEKLRNIVEIKKPEDII